MFARKPKNRARGASPASFGKLGTNGRWGCYPVAIARGFCSIARVFLGQSRRRLSTWKVQDLREASPSPRKSAAVAVRMPGGERSSRGRTETPTRRGSGCAISGSPTLLPNVRTKFDTFPKIRWFVRRSISGSNRRRREPPASRWET